VKVLITGAGGQLGMELAQYLGSRGLTVVAATRVDLDIRDRRAIDSMLARHAPDWVINCAAYTDVDRAQREVEQAFAVNRDGAGSVASAASAAGIGLLQISTDYVFDGLRSTPYGEDAGCHPLNVYGQSKWEGEQAVRSAAPDAIVLRTSWVYGLHGKNFVKSILRAARERERLQVVMDQVGAPTWTRDIARTIHLLLGSDAGGVFHFSAEGAVSWFDVARHIVERSRALGMDLRVRDIQPVTTSGYGAAALRPAYSVLNKDKIRSLINGLVVPDWRDSLNTMLKEVSTCTDCW
jgi:dTDP-4-dehydrorhamnose reductase